MVDWQETTVATICGTTLAMIVYDVIAAIRGGEKATISHVIAISSMHFPVIAFAVGVLCGHFFWPNP